MDTSKQQPLNLIYWASVLNKHGKLCGNNAAITISNEFEGSTTWVIWEYITTDKTYISIYIANTLFTAFPMFIHVEHGYPPYTPHKISTPIRRTFKYLFPEGKPDLDEIEKIGLGILQGIPELTDLARDVLERG